MTDGRTVVGTPVAEKIAAMAALGTPGVIRLEPTITALAASLGRRALDGWRTGRGALPPTAGVRAEITGARVSVEVSLATELGRAVPDVAERAQRRIAAALTELGGFAITSVTVLVVDVDRPARPAG